ncbi:MAG TPA: DegT/DnrJ/EryC1/StrS family aminotransferase, partial [Elusimicrobiales bacterium]|nr:DegT/DnrJ/EryC1/StrS family aminotransferase [Elusimicrobiales bacterium]
TQEAIHCLDIKLQYQQIKDEVAEAVTSVCEQTAFSSGPFVDKFEKEFAEFSGVPYCCGLNNGTSALQLAVIAAGVKPGDEVIVPANTFIATAWAVSYAGATPVFADCLPDTWNINPAEIARLATKKTKAVIGVHLYGQPCDIDGVKKAADDLKLTFIEDCAQAHGAKYRGRPVGKTGFAGCFSFYPGKNLGAYGEAGAVVCSDAALDKHFKSLRNHGSTVRYHHDELGFNMRMDGIQAAILSVKLKRLAAWNERRKQIARMYQRGIKNSRVTLQAQPEWSDSVYHLFVLCTEKRDELLKHLENNGIHAGLHYPVPCHLQKAYASLGYKKGSLPNAEKLAQSCLSLPMYAELSDEQVERVINAVNGYQ